jgi:hypothetical protein
MVGNDPVNYADAFGLLSVCSDKCKEGNVRNVQAKASIFAYLGFNPATFEAGVNALDAVGIFDNISTFASFGPGLTAEEVIQDAAKTLLDASSDKAIGLPGDIAPERIQQIEKTLRVRNGVAIWVRLVWQKCEKTSVYGLPFTQHLDWADKSDWYQSPFEGRLEGGFDLKDRVGIARAIPPSKAKAIRTLIR